MVGVGVGVGVGVEVIAEVVDERCLACGLRANDVDVGRWAGVHCDGDGVSVGVGGKGWWRLFDLVSSSFKVNAVG